ncbi:MAG: RraA family protein [Miltoncostaeaceae bacterium]
MNTLAPELAARLQQISCSSLVDAVRARWSHPSYVLDLVSPTPGRVLFGPAITVAFMPARADLRHPVDHDFAANFYAALQDGGEGSVLVMSNGGHPDAALGGSRKLSRLNRAGLAGVLADGRLRDFDELAEYGFTTYCRGETVAQGGDVVMCHAANVPVEIGGVAVVPGDYVYADGGGAVVIPAPALDEVLDYAETREARDRASMEAISSEKAEDVMRSGEVRPEPPRVP